ncbi:Gfo/Idh/MocA family protein, partial [Aneurinibacillus sp. REN35]|uniref:Gfo/Idh/MocA family protein n=1 Tax=Aneurinibacillus sp. REN35 TaxID=3237286 RepID=UPI003526DEBF
MVGFAVIGCGHIARKHIEAIEKTSNAQLIAVCDTNVERMEDFAKEYEVAGYLDIETMFQSEPNINVVSICVPSGLHAKLAVQSAHHKKHIVVEKPIALTLEDADSIIEACNANQVKLTVVHPNRFRPAVMALREVMDNKLFGKVSHANATVRWNRNQAYYDQAAWRGTKELDGGVLMNQAIHNLDLLLWLMGPIEEVQSYTATRLRSIEAEDVAVAILKFEDGSLGIIEAAATVYPKNFEESLSIFGETGTAVISGRTANWIKHMIFEGMSEEETAQLINQIEQDP